MKAVVCREYGSIDNLSVETLDDPETKSDEVLLKVLSAGVNFPDGLLIQGMYQAKPELPFVPGMECCGEVISAGSNTDGLSPGDRVICSSATYGVYAEHLAIAASQVIPVPQEIPPAQACNLLVAHGTAHHALQQRAQLQPGETLVVLGAAGGTGIAAVQIGKAMGARVIAAASSTEKLALARDNGADELINYSEENLKDAIKKHTDGGADVIYDPVGGELFDAGVRAMKRNGRYLVIGFASGTIPKLPVNLALVKEFSLVGVFWGTFTRKEPALFVSNMKTLFEWHRQGLLSVHIDKTFTLDNTAAALNYVMNRNVRGKVAIEINRS